MEPPCGSCLTHAAEVVNNLTPMGVKFPATESQTRELAPLDPELQKAVW